MQLIALSIPQTSMSFWNILNPKMLPPFWTQLVLITKVLMGDAVPLMISSEPMDSS